MKNTETFDESEIEEASILFEISNFKSNIEVNDNLFDLGVIPRGFKLKTIESKFANFGILYIELKNGTKLASLQNGIITLVRATDHLGNVICYRTLSFNQKSHGARTRISSGPFPKISILHKTEAGAVLDKWDVGDFKVRCTDTKKPYYAKSDFNVDFYDENELFLLSVGKEVWYKCG